MIKVLLIDDVESLGYLGDVVEVKEGYARNYLLPQGFAKVPTENNLRAIAKEKVARAEQRQLQRKQLEQVSVKLEGAKVEVTEKANETGRLFGSVTAKEIGENLRKQGFEVRDDQVKLDEHIKEVGNYDVTVKLAIDLKVKIALVVNGIDAEGKPVVVAQEASEESADETESEE